MAPDPSDSEKKSSASVAVHEKALVGALITAVHDTLKIEDLAGAFAEVSVPFGFHKPVRTAKVLPYLSYFEWFIYKDWECLQWGHQFDPCVRGYYMQV